MTIQEILLSLLELANERPEDYIQHVNPDGNNGGWWHKMATIGMNVFIGKNSIVMRSATMGDDSRMGENSAMGIRSKMLKGSTMGDGSVILPNSRLGDGQTLDPGATLAIASRNRVEARGDKDGVSEHDVIGLRPGPSRDGK
jgi:UDP-3-O-[3-hydroxymyristoyl] glucosamine N-acyltransferase